MGGTDLRNLVDRAAATVGHLPEILQPAAFAEVFRLLLRETPDVSQPADDRQEGVAPDVTALSSSWPSATVVKQRGSRIQKAIFAVAALAADGRPATSAAIEGYLKQRLASPVTKITDVLRLGVPQYLDRDTVDNRFVYSPTRDGVQLVSELNTTRD